MASILPFLTKTRLGVALMVAIALGSVIVTQYLTISGYEERLENKTADAAACQVSKAVAVGEIDNLESEIQGIQAQLKIAEAKSEAAGVRASAEATGVLAEADKRAGDERQAKRTAEEMTSWYESVWQ